MKYVSIDLETTGLDEEYCQIIEIGAVVDDTSYETPVDKLPTFHCYVVHPYYSGEPYALHMHADIFSKLHHRPEGWRYEPITTVAGAFQLWIAKHFEDEKATIAGKNFMSFDMNFMKKLPNFDKSQFAHRCIDPAMRFWQPSVDEKIPNLKTCMERAGIKGEVTHTALEDAFQVIKLLRYEEINMPSLENVDG
jgi:oligoribonuclease (3'-5' exoribonuclease)